MILKCARCDPFMGEIEPITNLTTTYNYCGDCFYQLYLLLMEIENKLYSYSILDKSQSKDPPKE